MNVKNQIFYARTYRHLKINKLQVFLYLVLLVFSVFLLVLYFIPNIVGLISNIAVKVLSNAFPGYDIVIKLDKFPLVGDINFVEFPTTYPSIGLILVNFVFCITLSIFCVTGKRKNKPLSIFLLLMLLIHTVSCVYFIFAKNYFPYTVFSYSNLYIKQQIGIWLTFIILTGLLTGFTGNGHMFLRLITFLGTILYSLVFGGARYILFLFLIKKFSILYMPIFFFGLGPFFDFVYLVCIYSLYFDKLLEYYDGNKGRGNWIWS